MEQYKGDVLRKALTAAIGESDPSGAIYTYLRIIGESLKADRCCYLEMTASGDVMATYTWYRTGVPFRSDLICDVQKDYLNGFWIRKMRDGEVFVITDIQMLDGLDSILCKSLQKLDIRSGIWAPTTIGNQCVGFMTLENPEADTCQLKDVMEQCGYFMASLIRNRNNVRRIEQYSQSDQLTGLANRTVLYNHMRDLPEDTRLGILFCDLDGLKRLNDLQGHPAGDLLLKDAASLLQVYSQGGTCYRIGGDEFLVVWKNIPNEEFFTRTAILRNAFKEKGINVSIGPVWKDCVTQPFSEILAEADQKMYVEKMRRHAQESLNKRETTVATYSQAMKNGEFTFYLQPKVHVETGKIVGAEALARWEHNGAVLTPDKFLDDMEEKGNVYRLDSYIWESVCKFQRRLIDQHQMPLYISINISAKDFYAANVTKVLLDLVEKYRLPKELIRPEIKESSVADDSFILDCAEDLHNAGFRVLLDDFGKDYTSMQRFKEMRIDVIKVIRDVHTCKSSQSWDMLERVANGAQKYGIFVQASGVETAAERDELITRNIHYAQGYFWYRPMSQDEYAVILSDRNLVDTAPVHLLNKADHKLNIRKLAEDGILTPDILESVIGPMAMFHFTEGRLTISAVNKPFTVMTGISEQTAFKIDDLRDMLLVEDGQIEKDLESAQQHPLQGKKFLYAFMSMDKRMFNVAGTMYFLGNHAGHMMYCATLHRYLQRHDEPEAERECKAIDPCRLLMSNTSSAILIADRETEELLFVNNAMLELYPPAQRYAKGITAREYLFGMNSDIPSFDKMSEMGLVMDDRTCPGKTIISRTQPIEWGCRPAWMTMVEDRPEIYYDSLTGLINMDLFRIRANALRTKYHNEHEEPAILYCDISGMKSYNATFGFAAGDVLLKDTARVLSDTFTEGCVTRFSDDHFLVYTCKQGLQERMDVVCNAVKYSLQGTTQGRYLTGGVPPVRFSM